MAEGKGRGGANLDSNEALLPQFHKKRDFFYEKCALLFHFINHRAIMPTTGFHTQSKRYGECRPGAMRLSPGKGPVPLCVAHAL